MKTMEEMIKYYNLQFFMEYKGIKIYKGIIDTDECYIWFTYNNYYERDLMTRYSTRYTLQWIKSEITRTLKWR